LDRFVEVIQEVHRLPETVHLTETVTRPIVPPYLQKFNATRSFPLRAGKLVLETFIIYAMFVENARKI